jgi:hypothetical protein
MKRTAEGYLGRLFGQIPPELAALQPFKTQTPNFVKKGAKIPKYLGKWAPWSFDGHHLKVHLVNYYYPDAYRRRAAEYYAFYQEVPPPEFSFSGVRARPFKDGHCHFWNNIGGLPRPVLKLVTRHLRYPPPDDVQNFHIKMEALRQGAMDFLKRNPRSLQSEFRDVACFMSQVWDSLRIGLQYAGISISALRRSILIEALVTAPESFAQLLKADAGICRRNAIMQEDNPLQLVEEMNGVKGISALNFSMLARSLPAPLHPDQVIDPYLERMTKEPAEIHPEGWLRDWFRGHMPEKLKHLGFTIGTSACVEFSRRQGGLPAACATLVALGHRENNGQIKKLFSQYDGIATSQLGMAQLFWAEGELGVEFPIAYKWRCLLFGSLLVVEAIQREGIIPPAYVIEAPEKGLKTRIPTAGIAPVVILQHVLRSYIDQFLARDCRIGPSISPGDAMRNPIIPNDWEEREDYHLRSLDATTATDNHPFKWQRSIYQELFKYLPETEWFGRLKALIPTLLGPRCLVTDRECGFPLLKDKEPLPPWVERMPIGLRKEAAKLYKRSHFPLPVSIDEFGWPAEDKEVFKTFKDLIPPPSAEIWASCPDKVFDPVAIPTEYKGVRSSLAVFPVSLEKIIDFYRQFSGTVSERGAMMGEPTSWPGLSLINVMTWEMSVPFERWYKLRTTGDDALAFTTDEDDVNWNKNLLQHGVELSENKDYVSKLYGNYTEVLVNHKGEPLGVAPLSTLVGPFGGSKGTLNWAACPAHTQIVCERVNAAPFSRRFFKTSRFWPQWIAAKLLRLPINYPLSWGGIEMDSNVILAKMTGATLRRWAFHLGNLSIKNLVLESSSLAITKGPNFGPSWSQVLNKAAEFEVAGMLSMRMRRQPCPDFSSAEQILKAIPPEMKVAILKDGAEKIEAKLLAAIVTEYNKDPNTHYRDLAELTRQFRSMGAVSELLNGRRAEEGEKAPSVIRAAQKFHRVLRPKPSHIPIKIGVRTLIRQTDEKRVRFLPQPLGSLNVLNVVEDNARSWEDIIAPREFPGRKYRS